MLNLIFEMDRVLRPEVISHICFYLHLIRLLKLNILYRAGL